MLQNYPTLSSATVLAGGTRVRGMFRGLASSSFVVGFYASVLVDPSGSGEGQRWLGAQVVTTNRAGRAQMNSALGETVQSGEFITATQVNVGHTSEFSAAV